MMLASSRGDVDEDTHSRSNRSPQSAVSCSVSCVVRACGPGEGEGARDATSSSHLLCNARARILHSVRVCVLCVLGLSGPISPGPEGRCGVFSRFDSKMPRRNHQRSGGDGNRGNKAGGRDEHQCTTHRHEDAIESGGQRQVAPQQASQSPSFMRPAAIPTHPHERCIHADNNK